MEINPPVPYAAYLKAVENARATYFKSTTESVDSCEVAHVKAIAIYGDTIDEARATYFKAVV